MEQTELLTQILITQNQILEELQRSNQKQEQLGFVDPPVIRRIYCNLQYDGLYHWNGGTKQAEILPTMAISCYVEGLKVEEGTYKNKPNNKLLVLIRADKRYVLVMGIETLTTKSLLLGLLQADLKQAVTFSFQVGTAENALFCDVYQNGKSGFEEGRSLKDLSSGQVNQMIAQVDDRLQGFSGSDAFGQIESDGDSATLPPHPATTTPTDPKIKGEFLDRLAKIREFTALTKEQVADLCKPLQMKPGEATRDKDKFIELRRAMLIEWGCTFPVWNHRQHCANSLDKLMTSELDLSDAKGAQEDVLILAAWNTKCLSKDAVGSDSAQEPVKANAELEGVW